MDLAAQCTPSTLRGAETGSLRGLAAIGCNGPLENATRAPVTLFSSVWRAIDISGLRKQLSWCAQAVDYTAAVALEKPVVGITVLSSIGSMATK